MRLAEKAGLPVESVRGGEHACGVFILGVVGPKRRDMVQRNGFTLIELLIVVAIIGILAAIAVPNFMIARGKAKATRAVSDMRAIAVALEEYYLDNNAYPPDSSRPGVPIENYPWQEEGKVELMCLTSPVAYLSEIPRDPFHSPYQYGAGHPEAYAYAADKGLWGEGPVAQAMKEGGKNWMVISCGPDRDLDLDEFRLDPSKITPEMIQQMLDKKHWSIYHASNGLVSSGDLPWAQGVGIPPI